MITKNIVRGWLNQAMKRNATHLVILCDAHDRDCCTPVYVTKDKSVEQTINERSSSGLEEVLEVYDMSMDFREQLKESKVFS